jgi:hypothetical protein
MADYVDSAALQQIEALRLVRGRERLRQQLLWRIRRLGGRVDLGIQEHEEVFGEVFAAFEPSSDAHLILVPSQFDCEASLDEGGAIAFGGVLDIAANPVAVIRRRLFLRRRFVYHEYFEVFEPYRDHGIAVAVLQHSFRFFDELGMRFVVVQAALETGRWYWARCGYTFLRPVDRAGVDKWAQQVLKRLGVSIDTSHMTEPVQFLELDAPRLITIGELAEAFPDQRERFEKAARANRLGVDEAVPLGKAILVCGPEWWGRLDLHGPSRAAFDVYARNRLAAVARRLGLEP